VHETTHEHLRREAGAPSAPRASGTVTKSAASPLRLGLGARLGGAAVAAGLLWLATLWALS